MSNDNNAITFWDKQSGEPLVTVQSAYIDSGKLIEIFDQMDIRTAIELATGLVVDNTSEEYES